MYYAGTDYDLTTFILFVLLGIGSWITINGVFAELPLIVNDLPEGWAIGTYLGLSIQIANVGPTLYSYLRYKNLITLHGATYFILSIGTVATVLIGVLWKETTTIAGVNHSSALIILVFFAAIVDCTTSLLFWPFVGEYRSQYVPALSLGEGLTGLVASGLSWIQTAKSRDHLILSVSDFFYILGAMMAASMMSFFLLRSLARALAQRNEPLSRTSKTVNLADESVANDPLLPSNEDRFPANSHLTGDESRDWTSFTTHIIFSLGILSVYQNGVRPAIMTYACMPYGSVTYHVANTMLLCMDPIGAVAAYFYRPSPFIFILLFVFSTLSVAYLLLIAALSPTPPLQGQILGSILVVLIAVFGAISLSVAKTGMLLRLKLQDDAAKAKKNSLLYYQGLSVQVGAFFGSVLMFLLVNVGHVFKELPYSNHTNTTGFGT
eukprot:m.37451 g.37451  ORF g.37451 m.37451 type:complete len:436 (+) comp9316_c0_seq2:415-1722(+)